MPEITKSHIVNLKQMQELASNLCKQLRVTDVVALSGDLGSGKTTFAGFLINSMLKEQLYVTSPTFNLVHVYDSSEGSIWHFDLYRLNSSEEVFALGIEEAFNSGISIIEWPEIISNLLPKNTIRIKILFNEEANLRSIIISQPNDHI